MYGNSLQDSSRIINLSEQFEDKSKALSSIYGTVLNIDSIQPMVVGLYNAKNSYQYLTFVDNYNNFSFSNLEAGFYFLHCYENYNASTIETYPYFPGDWASFKNSSNFSEIIGPIEIRENWDIEDIVINFK